MTYYIFELNKEDDDLKLEDDWRLGEVIGDYDFEEALEKWADDTESGDYSYLDCEHYFAVKNVSTQEIKRVALNAEPIINYSATEY